MYILFGQCFYAFVGQNNLPHQLFAMHLSKNETPWPCIVVENTVTNQLQKSIVLNKFILLRKRNLARVQDVILDDVNLRLH